MRSAAVRKARPRAGRAAKPASPETLTEQAYRQLEEQIVTLRLKPGEFLSEYALAEGLAIGRTPIREALQRLAREGLVTILPRKGILVSETDPEEAAAGARGAPRARAAARAGSAPSAPARSSARASARSPTAWIAPPRATTTSPSCASTASSTC